MSQLEKIRERLRALENRNTNRSSGPSDNYPFWNLDADASARVRFLPDANEENTFFWVERQMINLEFPGIKGDNEDKTVKVQVPCVEMWGGTCPILTEVRPWWNDESLKDQASKYWVKRNYLFQGLIQESALVETEVPENPIRKFVMGKQIFNIIKSSLMDPDFETIPTDFINGTDFIITRTQKGQYADYSTSKWSRKESALTEAQLEAIKEHGLKDLSELLPAKPSSEHLTAMYEMFEASVEGELYDPARWAKYYRPYGYQYQEDAATKVSMEAAPKTDPTSDDIPFDTEEKSEPVIEEVKETAKEPTPTAESPAEGAGKSAEDILAMIRKRNES